MTTVEPTPQDDMMEEGFKEEAVPVAQGDDNCKKDTRLSMISKMYDIDGDGKLDEAELAMRNMDTSSRGYLTNDKVYELMQQNFQMQRDLFKFRNVIIWYEPIGVDV